MQAWWWWCAEVVFLEAEDVQLATHLTDFRASSLGMTFSLYSVRLEPCACFCWPVVQVWNRKSSLIVMSCPGIVQVGWEDICVCGAACVQSTITVALHPHWLPRRAAVAGLEAVRCHSLVPQSEKNAKADKRLLDKEQIERNATHIHPCRVCYVTVMWVHYAKLMM